MHHNEKHHKMTKKSIAAPDEVRTFAKGKLELVEVGGVVFGKATLLPGWKWSESVKPVVGTQSCLAPHTQYHISGRLHVVMDDGSEEEFGPGDIGNVPPGHDAWVVGDEPVVMIDVTGMKEYAKK
ncbi:MAG: cupin domain-containing protein [Syntrophobacteraceae bacterium]|jgi:mannose-6-phosphate isomerase-like protein (cupin superfamily)